MIETLNAPASPAHYERARRQAEELEGVFLHTLVKQMFASIRTDGDFGGGFGEETWRSMQAEHIAQSMAEAGGIGLADAILGDLLGAQEAASALNAPSNALSAYAGARR